MKAKWLGAALWCVVLAGCGQGRAIFNVDVHSFLKGTGSDTVPYFLPPGISGDTASTPQKVNLPGVGSSIVDSVRAFGTIDLRNATGSGSIGLQVYLAAGSDNEYSPRHERKQGDGQVVPERVRVVIEVGSKAREILPKKKLVKELRIADLQRDVPGQRNKAEKHDTRNPQTLPQQANFTLNKEKNHDHQNRQKRRYGPFRERTQRKQSVEPGQINPVSALIPGVPTEQCNGESCGKSHVHGSGAGIPDDARAGGGDERAIKMKARPEAAQK